ncbi:MAG: DinB family protein [Vicingaceae bacterium]
MSQALANHNFSEYFSHYVNLAKDYDNVITALEFSHKRTNELLDLVTEEQGNFAYAEKKWSIKELLVHLIDTERIFCNRALRFARNDKTDLPGYDHDAFVPESRANERKLCEICKEYDLVRQATIALFKSFTDKMLEKNGTANGNHLTVLSIGFILSGHETHHINILEERYL